MPTQCKNSLCAVFIVIAIANCSAPIPPSNTLDAAGHAAAQYSPPSSASAEAKVAHWHDLIAELSAGNEGLKTELERAAGGLSDTLSDKTQEAILRDRAGRYLLAEKEFPTAQEHLNAAYEFEKTDSVDVALRHFQKVAELEPTKSEAYAGIGRCQARSSRFAEAIAAFRKACELAPDRPAWQLSLGDALYMQGDRDGALAAYKQALKIHPKVARAFEGIAKVHWSKGEFDAAKSSLEQATALGAKPDPLFVERLNRDAAAASGATSKPSR